MGQLINEEDCPVCEEFSQGWIFTYGDLITLLLCFFILIFSMCRIDDEKIKEISQSFKSAPPGSPFMFQGKRSIMESIAKDIEELDMPDEVKVNVSEKGVEVTFKEMALFQSGSIVLSQEAKESFQLLSSIIGGLSNPILVEGHTDTISDTTPQYPSKIDFSLMRAAAVADFLTTLNIQGKRIKIVGYGDMKPRFFNDTPYKRSLNRRVEVILEPEDYE